MADIFKLRAKYSVDFCWHQQKFTMTLNDLECPIQLKVCMSHDLLADSVDTSLASLLYSCKTDAMLIH